MRRFRASAFAYLIALLGFLLSLAAYFLSSRATEHYNQIRFDAYVSDVSNEIETRMQAYVTALVQAKAFLDASKNVTRQEFRRYVEASRILERFPGALGLGYAARIRTRDLARHERQVRATGFPDYRVWPESSGDDHFTILFLEPFNWRNKRAFGYDMFTEERRRQAMSRARDTGMPTMTSSVNLVQETRVAPQLGFLIYVPVYDSSLPIGTMEERRKALIGFIYAPFRARDLFDSVFFRYQQRLPVVFQIYDLGEGSKSTLLYQFNRDQFNREAGNSRPFGSSPLGRIFPMKIAGHPWLLRLDPAKDFAERVTVLLPPLIGIIGLLITVLLFRLQVSNEKEKVSRRLLEEALHTRDEFLSIASHELKTPITPLKLQLDMILRQIRRNSPELTPEKMTRALDSSMRSLGRLSHLIDDLLDVSRIANGRMRFSFEQVDLGDLIRDAVARFSGELSAAGSQVLLDLESGVQAWCDSFRMEQVFVNLLSNAMKYGAGSPIRVAVRAVHGAAEIVVSDQGIGISEQDQARIFDRFERVNSSSNIRGLGLGLYITRMIVDAHGGSIRVSSTPGRGSTFTVTIPLEQRGELRARLAG